MTGTSETIFKTVPVDMERLFVAPEKNDTTRIAALLSRCIIPLDLGILNLPSKILKEVESGGESSEEIVSNEAIEIYKLARKIDHRMNDKMIFTETEDKLDIFLMDALRSAETLCIDFIRSLVEFCKEIDTVRDMVSSEKSFYMSKTLGTEIEVDTDLIQIAVQNYVHSLNVSASGLNGYKILSLVKIINEIGEIVDNDSTMKFYGCTDKTSLVNKLGYRILPGQMALDSQMNKLIDLIFEIEGSNDSNKDRLIEIFNLSESVRKGLEKENKSVVISTPKPSFKKTETPKEVYVETKVEKKVNLIKVSGEDFDRSLVGKNAFIKEGAGIDDPGVGKVVAILPAGVNVSDGKRKMYFKNVDKNTTISDQLIDCDRIVIKSDTGQFYVFTNDSNFKSKVSII